MKVSREKDRVEDFRPRWRAQFLDGMREGFKFWDGKTPAEVWASINALPWPDVTAKDVKAVIGNDSWCGNQRCHECGEDYEAIIEVGQPPDYESHTAQMCEGCLIKALGALRAAVGKSGGPDNG